MFTVLGVDTGFRHVGYAITTINIKSEIALDAYGFWDLQAEHKKMNRRSYKGMITLNKKLTGISKKHKLDAICLETVPPTRFNGRDATLASTNMLRAWSIFNDLSYSELHSMTVKKEIAGYGKADKDQVKEAVLKMFSNLEEDLRYDVYDAIAVSVVSQKQTYDFWDFAS